MVDIGTDVIAGTGIAPGISPVTVKVNAVLGTASPFLGCWLIIAAVLTPHGVLFVRVVDSVRISQGNHPDLPFIDEGGEGFVRTVSGEQGFDEGQGHLVSDPLPGVKSAHEQAGGFIFVFFGVVRNFQRPYVSLFPGFPDGFQPRDFRMGGGVLVK